MCRIILWCTNTFPHSINILYTATIVVPLHTTLTINSCQLSPMIFICPIAEASCAWSSDMAILNVLCAWLKFFIGCTLLAVISPHFHFTFHHLFISHHPHWHQQSFSCQPFIIDWLQFNVLLRTVPVNLAVFCTRYHHCSHPIVFIISLVHPSCFTTSPPSLHPPPYISYCLLTSSPQIVIQQCLLSEPIFLYVCDFQLSIICDSQIVLPPLKCALPVTAQIKKIPSHCISCVTFQIWP